jgi:hypothetical protein
MSQKGRIAIFQRSNALNAITRSTGRRVGANRLTTDGIPGIARLQMELSASMTPHAHRSRQPLSNLFCSVEIESVFPVTRLHKRFGT